MKSKKHYQSDKQISLIIQDLNEEIGTSIQKGYSIKNGIIYYKDRIYLPKIKEILDYVMYEYHDKITSGHFGFLKTYSNISKKYCWNSIKR